MPGFGRTHTFEGLGEFRDMVPQLATASAHPVYVDLGEGYDANNIDGTTVTEAQQLRHQAIWNDRDDNLAYIGTDDYEITQHSELLQVIDDAVGQTVGEIDIGRVRDYGSRIDGMVTLNGHNVDVGALVGDGYVPPEGELMSDRAEEFKGFGEHDGTVRDILGVGIRFGNSFDGSERIQLETMGYRYICQNWMVWGKETIGEFEQLHIRELDAGDIENLIFDVIEKKDDQEAMIVESVEDTFPVSWVPGLLENIGFGARYQKHITQKLHSYQGVDEGDVSRWDVYNAATDYLDHEVAESVNPNVYDRHQEKVTRLLTEDASAPEEEVEIKEFLGIEA